MKLAKNSSGSKFLLEKAFRDGKLEWGHQTGEQIFLLIAQHFITLVEKEVEETKELVDQKFHAFQSDWQPYLNLDGSGLFLYFENLFKISK